MNFLSHKIHVRLKTNSYDVLIGNGVSDQFGSTLQRLGLGTHPVILTNPTLARNRQFQKIIRSLRSVGLSAKVLTVPDTEKSKSMPTLTRLLHQMSCWDRPGQQAFLILIGGGVIGDLGGVAAGLYKRGIPYVHVPTTLLAQVDSSIGGKAAVDLPMGKNLVGLFYQPSLVFTEIDFLKTLPERQFRSGLAEIIKCSIIQRPDIFSLLERTTLSELQRQPKRLAWLIAQAVHVKSSIVEQDEQEKRGLRTFLNLGHTLGHALEAATSYGKTYTHGEAVAIGICVAAAISTRLDLLSEQDAARIEQLIQRYNFPTTIKRGMSLSRILKAMSHDKKWMSGAQRWVLPVKIGRVIVRDQVPQILVQKTISAQMEG